MFDISEIVAQTKTVRKKSEHFVYFLLQPPSPPHPNEYEKYKLICILVLVNYLIHRKFFRFKKDGNVKKI